MTMDENVAAEVMICKVCPIPHILSHWVSVSDSDICTLGYNRHQVPGVVSEVVTIVWVLVNGGCSWSEQKFALSCRRWNTEETCWPKPSHEQLPTGTPQEH